MVIPARDKCLELGATSSKSVIHGIRHTNFADWIPFPLNDAMMVNLKKMPISPVGFIGFGNDAAPIAKAPDLGGALMGIKFGNPGPVIQRCGSIL